jgi:hypothetical protein
MRIWNIWRQLDSKSHVARAPLRSLAIADSEYSNEPG